MTKTNRLVEIFGKQIAQGDYAPGSALPSEAELCERFSVSRNVMREVIKVLATKRLIDAQPHRGLLVMPREQWNYLDADVLSWALGKEEDPELIRSLLDVQRQLKESNEAALRANRAKTVFLSHMSHDFRTPVNGILGMAERIRPGCSAHQPKRTSRKSARSPISCGHTWCAIG